MKGRRRGSSPSRSSPTSTPGGTSRHWRRSTPRSARRCRRPWPGTRPSSLQAHDVRIESTEIRGDSAKVTLFGTFCVYGTSSSTAPDCVTHDPGEAAGSGFAEYLLQVDGRWYIAAEEATAFR